MMTQTASSPVTYDLSAPQLRLEPILKSRRRFAAGMVVVTSALIAFLVGVSIRPIEAGTLPPILLPGLVFILAVLVFGTWLIFPSRAYLKSGAIELVSDPTGFTLRYPGRENSRVSWTDPNLAFDLIDMTRVKPSKLRTGDLYVLRIHQVQTMLTPETYEETLRQARAHGLVDNTTPGGRFMFAADASPIFHRVRGRALSRR